MQRIVEKLPLALRGKWCDFVSDVNRKGNRKPRFSVMAAFVERAAASANEPYFSKKAMCELRQGKQGQISKPPANSASFATQDVSRKCLYCGASGDHVSNCGDMGKLSLPERKWVVADRGLCWGCLNAGHAAKQCRQRLICSICTKRHPSILHDDNFMLRYGMRTIVESTAVQPRNTDTKLQDKQTCIQLIHLNTPCTTGYCLC